MIITEDEIKSAHPTKLIPGAPDAVWLGNVYGEDDDWRIYAVPIRAARDTAKPTGEQS